MYLRLFCTELESGHFFNLSADFFGEHEVLWEIKHGRIVGFMSRRVSVDQAVKDNEE